MSRFEELVKAMQNSPKPWRDAVVNVADSAFMCRAWLDSYTKGWTPSDLMAMTRMVLETEARDIARQLSDNYKLPGKYEDQDSEL